MAEGAVKRINELLAAKGQQFELVDSTRYPVSGGEIDPTNVEDELAQLAKTAEAPAFPLKMRDTWPIFTVQTYR